VRLRLELCCRTPGPRFDFAIGATKFCRSASHIFRSQEVGYENIQESLNFGPSNILLLALRKAVDAI
jgi:hypothetical protein